MGGEAGALSVSRGHPCDVVLEWLPGRRLIDAGHRIADLCKRYRVQRSVVSRIVHRQTHKEVPDDLEPLGAARPIGADGALFERFGQGRVR